jgi:hypothetical protein
VGDVKSQVGELCVGAAQTCLSVQQLQKRLILFQHHVDEVSLTQRCAQGTDELKAAAISNKDELDKSNTRRKW